MKLDLQRLDQRTAAILDILFIHGLNSDGDSAWRNSETDFFWPQGLAEDAELEQGAVWGLTYPADSTRWGSGAADMGLVDRARNVLQYLSDRGIGRRPLLMITHSLGGLLAKQMLHTAAVTPAPPYEHFADNTCGVVFLATPHTGSSLASLAKVLKTLFLTIKFNGKR